MSTTTQLPGVHTLLWTHGMLDKMLESLEGHMTHQAAPNTNHALWIAGHMATTDDYFVSTFGGGEKVVPEGWAELFGYGSEPSADASVYPDVATVRKTMNERRAALLAWVRSMDAETAATPLDEHWKPYAPTLGDLPSFMAAHEAMHVGQLATVRKALGLKPLMSVE